MRANQVPTPTRALLDVAFVFVLVLPLAWLRAAMGRGDE